MYVSIMYVYMTFYILSTGRIHTCSSISLIHVYFVPLSIVFAIKCTCATNSPPPAAALTDLDMPTINKLLTALNECTEWGQVFILDSLSNYSPESEQEAQNVCERVTPRLSHANAAVVLSAVKVHVHIATVNAY